MIDFLHLKKMVHVFLRERKSRIFHLIKLINMDNVCGKYLFKIQTRESYLNSNFKRSLNQDRIWTFGRSKDLDLNWNQQPYLLMIRDENLKLHKISGWIFGVLLLRKFVDKVHRTLPKKVCDLFVQKDFLEKIIINYFLGRKFVFWKRI